MLTVIVAVSAALSVVTYVVYARDKAAARAHSRRTPERTLLVLGLLGGWPGGLIAQRRLRHKSAKTSFLVRFWATVVVHVGAVAALGWATA